MPGTNRPKSLAQFDPSYPVPKELNRNKLIAFLQNIFDEEKESATIRSFFCDWNNIWNYYVLVLFNFHGNTILYFWQEKSD